MKREHLTNVTTESIDQDCHLLAKSAMSYAEIINGNLNEYPRSVATVVACANRIIALRTMHALGDLTIPAADRGAIAATLRSQQVAP